MIKNPLLVAYWIRFSGEPWLQHSHGVTAYSREDALELLKGHYRADQWRGDPVAVFENVRIQDLDQNHVAPNCGPLVFRGVWFPCLNLGDEAP